MRDEQIKELISAYLDGELSIDERAQVERQLADSVECQQFLDQFRRQRMALRSIPRRKLNVDLSPRVLQAIEQARPAYQAVSTTAVLLREQAAKRSWWRTWQGMAMVAGTVAALLMVAVYLTSANRNTNNDLVGPTVVPDVPKLPELPEVGPDEPLPGETMVAVRKFQELVQFVIIYDITITPQAQKNKVFDGWMAKAGIPINQGIAIDQKLEKEILAARFVGDDKIAAGANGKSSKQLVEMLFVRGTIKQIDAVYRQYLAIRDKPNPQVQIRLDMAAAPRELFIILQLNKAAGLDLAQMKSNPRLLKSPGAFPIQFHLPLHSSDSSSSLATEASLAVSTTSGAKDRSAFVPPASIFDAGRQLAMADSGLAMAQGNALTNPANGQDAQPVNEANSPDQAGQAIFIVRKLKEATPPDAN